MKIVVNNIVNQDGSLITYNITVEDVAHHFTADFLSDMDGNHAEWLGDVPAEFAVGEGDRWEAFADALGENEKIVADVEDYYNEG